MTKDRNLHTSSDEETVDPLEEFHSRHTPLWRLIVFGVGTFALSISQMILLFFQPAFLMDVVGIRPLWVGILLASLQVIDGLINPIIGHFSDRISHIWGRRRPWVFVFTLPALVLWPMNWTKWFFLDGSEGLFIGYFAIVGFLYNTTASCLSIPYLALISDVASTYEERALVVQFQQAFGQIGVVVGLFGQALIIEWISPDDFNGPGSGIAYIVAALIFSPFVVIPYIASMFAAHERPVVPKESKDRSTIISCCGWIQDFLFSLARVFSTCHFFSSYTILIFIAIATYSFSANFILYSDYVLEQEYHSSFLLLTMQLGAASAFFFWSGLSIKIGKKTTLFVGSLFWCLTSASFYFIDTLDIPLIYLMVLLRGIFSSVGLLIPLSMLSDAIAKEEREKAVRREALYYSIFTMFLKFSLALCFFGSAFILDALGYDTPESSEEGYEQPEDVKLALTLLVSVIPAAFIMFSFLPTFYFPISQSKSTTVSTRTEETFFD